MELDANSLALFARVAEAGSFSRAAERSELPKSTVSRRIAELESQLGERLFARSTRKLALTDFGQGLLEHARRLNEEAEAAAAFAEFRQSTPRGRLRVSMPAGFAELSLTPMLREFIQRYPDLRLEIDLSPRRVDLLAENFDLAIRIANQLPDDATLVARRLTQLTNSLFASPDYLAHRGPPMHPEDLHDYRALQLIGSSGTAAPWVLLRGEERWEGLPPGPLGANSVELLRQLAVEGQGIVALSRVYACPMIQSGALVPVLPDWSLPPMTVWAVTPGRRLLPSGTRLFIEAVTAALEVTAQTAAGKIGMR